MIREFKRRKRSQQGFSLLETLVAIAMLMIVLGIATSALVQMQKRAAADSGRLDMTQMTRQFVDQITNDLHQAGYPSTYMFDAAYAAANPNSVAVGLVTLTANSAEFEGDVDGSGVVSHVYLELLGSDGNPIPTGNGTCPCTLQRGVLAKSQVGTGAVPYYTEVTNVVNTDIFSADDNGGALLSFPISDLHTVRIVRIKVNLQSSVREVDGTFPTITMQSAAKIMNLKLN